MQSWRYMFWLTRAASGILLLVAVALLVPQQTRDMLEEISDAQGGITAALAFHFCLMILCFNLWHWSRTALSAWYGLVDHEHARAALAEQLSAKGIPVDITALKLVPRLLFLGGAVAGVGAALKSAQYLQALIVLVWAAAGYWFFTYRLQLQKRILGRESLQYCRPSRPPGWAGQGLIGSFWRTGEALLRHAPFGRIMASLFLVSAILLMLVGTTTSFLPWLSGWWKWSEFLGLIFPGPSAALFCLGITIAPLTFITYLFDQSRRSLRLFRFSLAVRHIPILALLFLVITLTPWLFDLHAVRIVQDKNATTPAARVPLGSLFQNWAQACATPEGPVRPIIVAVSGGASRAGLWAARILTQVDGVSSGHAAIFAVSSVSGGSLGAASYAAMRRDVAPFSPCFLPRNGKQGNRDEAIIDAVRADALGPTLAGSLFGDAPRALLGVPAAAVRYLFGIVHGQEYSYRGGDRAEALERAFEHNWDVHQPRLAAALDMKQPTLFSDPYLSLAYDVNHKPIPGMPLWLANGTDAQNGDRIITTPFAMETGQPQINPFAASRDALALLKNDVTISTGITNTARFPLLSPSGELAPEEMQAGSHPSQIIDGGYFENEGLQTALDLARWLRDNGPNFVGGRKVQPIIVQATADAGEVSGKNEGAVIRCHSGWDDPAQSLGRSRPLQLFAPAEGLNSVRAGHSNLALREARAEFCEVENRQDFFHFYLYKPEKAEVPLNWVLSRSVAEKTIWKDAFDGNSKEMAALEAALQQVP